MRITIAEPEDIPALVRLVNSAYRGESSKAGWTTEADMVEGSLRTDEEHLGQLMRSAGSVFLKYCNGVQELEGSVFLQKRDDRLYLGMLSVNPLLQARGIGKELMRSAEQYARSQGCRCLFMRVISIRQELIAWYERQGYRNTGETEPFRDSEFGKASRPIEFLVLQKDL